MRASGGTFPKPGCIIPGGLGNPIEREGEGLMQLDDLNVRAERIAALLKERRETVSVAESSTGGLIAAALLGVGGASAYFLGGAVIYTQTARRALLDIQDPAMAGMRASTEPYALLLARTMRARHGSTWAVAETGATGPTGNRYGDAAGHSCMAVVGARERAITLETGSGDRRGNMLAFAAAALELLETVLSGS
jgi:PncC family amidohydrolase